MNAWLLLLAVSASSPQRVVVVTTAVGFDDATAAALARRAVEEVDNAGASAVRPPRAVTPECLADAACVAPVIKAADARFLVAFELLRAGSRVAVSARLLDERGALVAEDATTAPLDKLQKGGAPLLSPALAARLTPPQQETKETKTKETKTESPAPAAPAAPPAPPAPAPPADVPLTVTALAGIGVTAVGALLVVGGSAAALGQNAVRLDASADGGARAATAVSIPVALGAAVVGLAGVGVGLGLLTLGGDLEG